MMAEVREWFHRQQQRKKALLGKLEQLDKQQREARHDIRDLQARTDYLRALIIRMRDDQWVTK